MRNGTAGTPDAAVRGTGLGVPRWRLRLAALVGMLLTCSAVAAGGARTSAASDPPARGGGRKVVFIAGIKSHGPGDHEYEKGVRLLARALETAPNLRGIRAEVHLYGWPEREETLADAAAIVVYCDGSDRRERDHPLLAGNRLEVLGRAMRRGAGLVLLHYAVFAPNERGGSEFLEWVGGYFDYQAGPPPRGWYSQIQTAETRPVPATPAHPIARGLTPFNLREEYYYRMRFREPDPRRVPILTTDLPGEEGPQTVAWAVERRDGGRGFAYTGGHFHANWRQEMLRRMVLNAITWCARAEVPAGGVQSTVPEDADHLRTLVLTGHHHPAHNWRETTQALREVLRADDRVRITVWEDPERLAREGLAEYDLVVQNYCNWEQPGLSDRARERLAAFVRGGGGLLLVHFANGAWSDWPDYRALCRRRWVDGPSGHDPYGTFRVSPVLPDHLLTIGLDPFETRDELYFGQQGDLPAAPILTARSKVTGRDEPLAFTYTEGRGRVFQCLLGHAAESIRTPAVAEILRRAAAWAAHREVLPRRPAGDTSLAVPLPLPAGPLPTPHRATSADWPYVGGDAGGTRYSPLAQIHRGNVRDLQVAWTYNAGDALPGNGSTIECTPLVVEGVLFLTTPRLNVAALDAATGREIWRFDPRTNGVNRGLAWWSDGRPHGERRLFLATPDGRLLSLDARTGRLDPNFGDRGIVHLRAGYERDLRQLNYGSTSAPAVFEDRVIIPIVNSEGQPGAPGDIRAFHVRTGHELWRFHTVPRPYEFGNDTWAGDSWKDRSGANPWAGFTVDLRRGLVFCGLGSAASDFYGGDRHGANLFANSTLALDARTGRRVWHFQTLHHDLWDHDLPCPPVLARVRRNGRWVDAAAQPTKTGYLFLFDRVTGQPLFPVEERPVPPSDVPGEQAYPTQPFPLKPPPFSRQSVTEADLTDISPEANAHAREQFRKLRGGQAFTPPSLQGTVVIPGFHGGANWSGAAFDPTSGLLYVNSNNVPNVCTLVQRGHSYDHTGYFRFLDAEGYPAIRPPWGNLTAIDLNRGEFAWQIVLGEYPELTRRGVPQTGTETFGGAIVTAGGLVFIGGTKDERFHAFDKATGRLLWQTRLPAGGYATPCTYMVNGRQYVVIAAGGGGKLGTRSGDAFVAFALPRR